MSKYCDVKFKTMNREEKIKDLQRQLDELKAEPVLEVGKWYKDTEYKNELWCITGKNRGFGFDAMGHWSDESELPSNKKFTPATPEEVETALIKEAKRRGFKEGVSVKSIYFDSVLKKHGKIRFELSENGKLRMWSEKTFYYDTNEDDNTKETYLEIFNKGKWAEIITEPKVVVNGYEMEQEGVEIKFGCARFHKEQIKHLYERIADVGKGKKAFNGEWMSYSNRKIKSITLDSGVEITVEQLKQIVDNIK